MKRIMLGIMMAITMVMFMSIGVFGDEVTSGGGIDWGSFENYVVYPVEGGNIYFDKVEKNIFDADFDVTGADIPKEIDGVPVKRLEELNARNLFFQNLEWINIP